MGCNKQTRAGLTPQVWCTCSDSDRTSIRTSDVLRSVAELELIQAPNLSFIPPRSYASLPQLKGEACDMLTLACSAAGHMQLCT